MKRFATNFLKSKITRAGVLLALVAATAATVAWSDHDQGSFKLEGSWIGKVPGTPVLWSYTVVPDPSGRTAAMSGSVSVPITPGVVGSSLFPDLEYVSPMVGQVAMTGRDTAQFTAVMYGMKKAVPFNQVVCIIVNNGESRFTGEGEAIHTNHLAFYYPSADADHDGLPDPGPSPALCLPPTVSLETRVPVLPPCTP